MGKTHLQFFFAQPFFAGDSVTRWHKKKTKLKYRFICTDLPVTRWLGDMVKTHLQFFFHNPFFLVTRWLGDTWRKQNWKIVSYVQTCRWLGDLVTWKKHISNFFFSPIFCLVTRWLGDMIKTHLQFFFKISRWLGDSVTWEKHTSNFFSQPFFAGDSVT